MALTSSYYFPIIPICLDPIFYHSFSPHYKYIRLLLGPPKQFVPALRPLQHMLVTLPGIRGPEIFINWLLRVIRVSIKTSPYQR